jgi:hypothetical protein
MGAVMTADARPLNVHRRGASTRTRSLLAAKKAWCGAELSVHTSVPTRVHGPNGRGDGLGLQRGPAPRWRLRTCTCTHLYRGPVHRAQSRPGPPGRAGSGRDAGWSLREGTSRREREKCRERELDRQSNAHRPSRPMEQLDRPSRLPGCQELRLLELGGAVAASTQRTAERAHPASPNFDKRALISTTSP